jgi:hypothetical protein
MLRAEGAWGLESNLFLAALVALVAGACTSRPNVTPEPSETRNVAAQRDQSSGETRLSRLVVVSWARTGLKIRVPDFISHGSSDTGAYWYGQVIVQVALRRLPMNLTPRSWSCRQVSDCSEIGDFAVDSVNRVIVGTMMGGWHGRASRAARLLPCDDSWYLELDVLDPRPQSSVPLDVINSASVTGMGMCNRSGSLDDSTG